MRRRGLTLLEMLVVMAILAIIAALLFPVFARSREGAGVATALSNFQQLHRSTLLYANDADGMMPYGFEGGVPAHIPLNPPIGRRHATAPRLQTQLAAYGAAASMWELPQSRLAAISTQINWLQVRSNYYLFLGPTSLAQVPSEAQCAFFRSSPGVYSGPDRGSLRYIVVYADGSAVHELGRPSNDKLELCAALRWPGIVPDPTR